MGPEPGEAVDEAVPSGQVAEHDEVRLDHVDEDVGEGPIVAQSPRGMLHLSNRLPMKWLGTG